jgi:hypothetical protein
MSSQPESYLRLGFLLGLFYRDPFCALRIAGFKGQNKIRMPALKTNDKLKEKKTRYESYGL